MKRNVLYLVFIGLVVMIMLLAGCESNGAGRDSTGIADQTPEPSLPRIQTEPPAIRAVYSNSFTSLNLSHPTGVRNAKPTPIVSPYTPIPDPMDVDNEDSTSTMNPSTPALESSINAPEGTEMYRVKFNNLETRSGIYFGNSGRTPIDISEYAGGNLVFSINYANLESVPDEFEVKLASGATGEEGRGINFIDEPLYRVRTADDWHTYKIPLGAFNTPNGSDLDLANMYSYFGLWEPQKSISGGKENINGIVYIDNIYFEAPTKVLFSDFRSYYETPFDVRVDGVNAENAAVSARISQFFGSVNPAEGDEMYKIFFPPRLQNGGAYFTIEAGRTPISIADYNEFIVFSINYSILFGSGARKTAPDSLIVKLTSGRAAETGGGEVDFLAAGTNYRIGSDDDWHTYKIPLVDFQTRDDPVENGLNFGGAADSGLNFDDMYSYFGLWNPAAEGTSLYGNVFIDDIYFEAPQP